MPRAEISIGDLPPALQRKARALVVAPLAVELGPDSPLRDATVTRKRVEDREHPIQVAIVEWADDPATHAEFPEMESLYSIPNEVGAGGKRSARSRQLEGAKKKARGRRKGMPDLVLPVPRRNPAGGVYGALYVEVKDETGSVAQAQRDRIALLRRMGNCCEIVMSVDAAKAIYINYLRLPKP